MGKIWRSVLLATFFSTFIFGTLILLGRQPFLADDWWWTWLPLSHPSFSALELYTFTRQPLLTIFCTWASKHNVFEKWPHLYLTCFFAIHAFAFNLLVTVLLEKVGKSNLISSRKFIAATVLFSFFPNDYEIHFWYILGFHALGALACSLAFRVQRGFLQFLLMIFALLMYESFFLLIVGYISILGLLKDKSLKPTIWVFGASVGVSIIFKAILAHSTGQAVAVHLESNSWMIFDHIKNVIKMMWQVHFYKTNWIFSVITWITWIWLAQLGRKRMSFTLREFLIFALIPTFSALPLIFNKYSAPRAFYGPQLLFAAELALLFIVSIELKDSVYRLWPIASFGCIVALHYSFILIVKNKNSNILEAEQLHIRKMMETCNEPCNLRLPAPGEGLSRDFVLPKMFWDTYYDRIHLKYFPHKIIHIEIVNQTAF